MTEPPNPNEEEQIHESQSAAETQRAERIAKAERMRAGGDEPYKLRFDKDSTVAEIVQRHSDLSAGAETDDRVAVAGRVMTVRAMGKLAFADLKDWSGRIQLFGRSEKLAGDFEGFSELDVGDWVGARGVVMKTKKGELSILVDSFEVLSKSLLPWPEKWHGLKDVELRYRQRYLDLATNDRTREILRVRTQAVHLIREWLIGRGFIEVETPMLQPLHGGAIAKPFVTFHETLGMNLYLRIAPELYLKRLLVGGIEKVFEINRNFRNEGTSVKYNPEFTMLELYQAFGDYHTMAELLENLIGDVVAEIHGGTKVNWQGREIDFSKPFRRAKIVDLVRDAGIDPDGDLAAECRRLGIAAEPSWGWGKQLTEIYSKRVEPNLMQPTFAMDYPREVSPLARQHRDDPRFTEHLDLVICGIEVGPAYSELTDPIEQRARFEEQAKQRAAGDEEAHVVDEDFLRALEYGMPPAGGLGMGIDRLVMILTDSASIREVILFPALRPG